MKPEDILTNSFHVEFDQEERVLRVHTIKDGIKSPYPIQMPMDSLLEMGKVRAAEWVGQSMLLLIPAFRRDLFDLEG